MLDEKMHALPLKPNEIAFQKPSDSNKTYKD